jgi:hypothetical protein
MAARLHFKNDTIKLFYILLNDINDINKKNNTKILLDNHYDKWKAMYEGKSENLNTTIIKEKERIDKIYDSLKQSVLNTTEVIPKPDDMLSKDNIKYHLNYYKYYMKKSKVNSRQAEYEIGRILFYLKTTTSTKKEFILSVKQFTGYSVSYAYWLIKLYKTCEKFPKLKCATLSTTILKNQFADLCTKMETDKNFWVQRNAN